MKVKDNKIVHDTEAIIYIKMKVKDKPSLESYTFCNKNLTKLACFIRGYC